MVVHVRAMQPAKVAFDHAHAKLFQPSRYATHASNFTCGSDTLALLVVIPGCAAKVVRCRQPVPLALGMSSHGLAVDLFIAEYPNVP